MVLNQLFRSVFNPSAQSSERNSEAPEETGEDGSDASSEMNLTDLFAGSFPLFYTTLWLRRSPAPTASPLSVDLHQRSIRVTFPLPHTDSAKPPRITLTISPGSSGQSPLNISWVTRDSADLDDHIRAKLDEATRVAQSIEVDLVKILQSIDVALR